MGEACLVADRLDAAIAFAERAFIFTREGGQRGDEAHTLRLLRAIASVRDPADTAEGPYRQAMALADELGMRPLVAHCHLGLGRLYRRIGDAAKAREHLTIAYTMYLEMGMTFWLE
jgi:hypothetical protein